MVYNIYIQGTKRDSTVDITNVAEKAAAMSQFDIQQRTNCVYSIDIQGSKSNSTITILSVNSPVAC